MDKYQQSSRLATILLSLLLLTLCGQQAAADSLFESEVVVTNQSPGVRAAALKTALRQLLVRVEGQDAVLETEPAIGLL